MELKKFECDNCRRVFDNKDAVNNEIYIYNGEDSMAIHNVCLLCVKACAEGIKSRQPKIIKNDV